MLYRKGNNKGGPFAKFTAGRNESIMLLDDLFAQRQANTGTLKFRISVQSLKHAKDLLGIALIESDTVIFYKNPAITLRKLVGPSLILVANIGLDPNRRWGFLFAVL